MPAWRFRVTRPDGTSYIQMAPLLRFEDRAEADMWCARANASPHDARRGCTYEVVPAPDPN